MELDPTSLAESSELAQKHTATSFFILGGNSNIVTPLNAFMQTFFARNVHFTFIMFQDVWFDSYDEEGTLLGLSRYAINQLIAR